MMDSVQAAPMAHSRMVESIGEAIASGTLQPGDRLASEVAMGQDFGISVTSVRKGLEELVDAGVIVRRRGSGTFVRPRRSLVPTRSEPAAVAARPRTVGLVLPLALRVYHPFFSEMLDGLQRELTERNWQVSAVAFHAGRQRDVQAGTVNRDQLLRQLGEESNLAGLIVGASESEWLREAFPTVPMVAPDPTPICPYVSYDWPREQARGLQELRDAGARNIWCCGLRADTFSTIDTRGLRVTTAAIAPSSLLTEVSRQAYDALLAAHAENRQIDGILAANDFIAQGVFDAVERLQLAVPERVRVVALVNRASRLETHWPFTRGVSDGREMSVALVRLLESLINSPTQAPRRVTLTCTWEHGA